MRRVANGALVLGLAMGIGLYAMPLVAQVADPADPTSVPPVTRKGPDSPPDLTPGVPTETPQPETPTVAPSVDLSQVQIQVPPLARQVAFTGNTIIPSDELVRIAAIKPGQLVSRQVLATAISNIEAAYQERGYVGAVVDLDLPEPGRVGTVTFHIAELKIVGIRIEGLRKVREDTVKRVLTFGAGQLYNQPKVVRDIAQIQQLGVFESVGYDLEPLRPAEAILVWKLEELAKFNYAEIGGSYSPSDNLVGTAQVTLGNLSGRAQRLNILAEVSSVEAQVGGMVRYFNPWIAPNSTSLLMEAFSVPRYRFSRDIANEPGLGRYFERRTGFRGVVSRQPRPFLTLDTALRFESVNVNNLPTDILTTTSPQDTNILVASLRPIWDRRNSVTNPSKGTLTTLFLEGGASNQEATGTSGIAKTWGDRRWYIPLRSRKPAKTVGAIDEMIPVLAIRTMLGGTLGEIPFSEQYFVGGIGDLPLRGYLEDRFWGKYAMAANLEYRQPVTRNFSGIAFVDVGDAWGSEFQFEPGAVDQTSFPQHRNFSPRAGAGVGVRYASPYGLLRLDVAYGDAWRTHLAIGQVF